MVEQAQNARFPIAEIVSSVHFWKENGLFQNTFAYIYFQPKLLLLVLVPELSEKGSKLPIVS